MDWRLVALLIPLFGLFAWIGYGFFSVAGIEEPSYDVVSTHEGYEIRRYDPYIEANVTVEADNYNQATNIGFSYIGNYIFGGNTSKQGEGNEKIAMTTPVTSTSEKIAMTAPVTAERGESWTIAFIMPSSYTLDSLPTPTNSRVQLKEVPGREMAVLRFSGAVGATTMATKEQELRSSMERDNLQGGKATYAQYNPPGTPPWMRRNEVLIEIIE